MIKIVKIEPYLEALKGRNLRKHDFEPLLDQHSSVPLNMGETRGKFLENPQKNEIIERGKFTPTLIPC